MIPRIEPSWQGENWQQQWSTAIRDLDTLERSLKLPAGSLQNSADAAHTFPLRVPLSYLRRIKTADLSDPLLLQILPTANELIEKQGFSKNPVGDIEAIRSPGLLQKYLGRALLITTGACPIHCRYCFRRHFPYAESHAAGGQWTAALQALAADTSIHEVILSGGDPLSLSDDKLAQLLDGLAKISHLGTLRIHTRLPVVLPDRITESLLSVLAQNRLQTVFVIHANHPNELAAKDVSQALKRIHSHGFTLLNQSVLLKGVNDNAATLVSLSKSLFKNNVLPYYLHQLDPVSGAAHFQLSDDKAREIHHQMRTQLPGYLLPRLVKELGGEPYKSPL